MYWYHPETAAILRAGQVTAGRHELTAPDFTVDLALLVTHDGAPDIDGDGIGDNADPDDDGDGFSDEEERKAQTDKLNPVQRRSYSITCLVCPRHGFLRRARGTIKDANRNVVVRGNTLYMSEPAKGRDGIVIDGAALVEANFIYNFGRTGISLGTYWNVFPNRAGAVIQNNVIVRCGGSRKYGWDYGLIVGGGDSGDQFTNTKIRHNTIASIQSDRPEGGIGVVVSKHARKTELKNNLFYDCTGPALSIGEDSLGDHGHNLFFSPQIKTLVQRGRERFAARDLHRFEPTSLGADPRLVEASLPTSADDLSVKPASPAVDAGISIPAVTRDFRGVPRPQGEGWDIGAFERKK